MERVRHSIENGFKGLINGEVKELSWMDVDDWAAKGGSKLGTLADNDPAGKRKRGKQGHDGQGKGLGPMGSYQVVGRN